MSSDNPLGRATTYRDTYAPELLYPLSRAQGRGDFAATGTLPFDGEDVWTAYELTWLGPSGRPEVAGLLLTVPADSPCLVESKSLKLYLGSFAQSRFETRAQVAETLSRDLVRGFGADVTVRLLEADALAGSCGLPAGRCLDGLDVTLERYQRAPELLSVGTEESVETLHSNLFRSLCPVTGQPDLASIIVHYRGPRIRPESLLAYLVSLRNHQAFHEATVEQLFVDITERCAPAELCLAGRFLRRGGIDINPLRWTPGMTVPESMYVRLPRQ